VAAVAVWCEATGGVARLDPALTLELARRGMAAAKEMCDIVENQWGWTAQPHTTIDMRRFKGGDAVPQPSFWSAYQTVLLVRDPWRRFLSHVLYLRWEQLPLIRNESSRLEYSLPEMWLDKAKPAPHRSPRSNLWFWWHNFLTQHLVAQDSSSCTPEVLRLGLASVTRYSIVLNIVDMPELSMRMAATCLGWNFASTSTHDGTFLATSTVTQDKRIKTLQASDKWRAAFAAANTCDEQLVQAANRRLRLDEAAGSCR